MKNVIIVGSGPAGITAGIYLTRAKIDNVVITNNQGALSKADMIENYYGFIQPIKGNELLENGKQQYLNLGGKIKELGAKIKPVCEKAKEKMGPLWEKVVDL